MDIKKLNSLCAFWQDKLGLAHWNIAIQICRLRDMPIPNSQATNNISLATEQSLISILDENDFPNSPFAQDMEVSLVHELLHIPVKYFAEPDCNSTEYFLMEAFIERIAKLLVQFDRNTKK